ncbi:glycine N-methyltransferase-like [Strongylocentrotus purpuratus]|uniref:Glycine N-methyltransferase n=1 Tax=Strongylocentrotus purpuratus TaxID=7668 RepID=A0A7M7HL95_STRPU|nr:glycine N-methyltransferase-like [Strongylocentrotus purpuratus]
MAFSNQREFEDDNNISRLGVLSERSEGFKQWVFGQLESRQCHHILEAACGTGGDSLLLLKKGYNVVSSDGSQAMVNYAKNAREEQQIETWDILQANWLTLKDDLHVYGGFDAVLCLSSSMVCLIDSTPNFDLYRRSFENFKSMLKPGGVLLIDHRNMDVIMDHGRPINKNVYFKYNTISKMASEVCKCPGKPDVTNITYDMIQESGKSDNCGSRKGLIEKVTIPLQPIRATKFASILAEVFGEDCEHALYADFKPIKEVDSPAYYQYVFQKTK